MSNGLKKATFREAFLSPPSGILCYRIPPMSPVYICPEPIDTHGWVMSVSCYVCPCFLIGVSLFKQISHSTP